MEKENKLFIAIYESFKNDEPIVIIHIKAKNIDDARTTAELVMKTRGDGIYNHIEYVKELKHEDFITFDEALKEYRASER